MKGPWTPQVEYISGSWTIFMLVLDLSCSDVLLRLVWGPETFDKSYKPVMCWFWFCCQKTSLKISRWFTATDADTQSWTVVSGLTVNVVGSSLRSSSRQNSPLILLISLSTDVVNQLTDRRTSSFCPEHKGWKEEGGREETTEWGRWRSVDALTDERKEEATAHLQIQTALVPRHKETQSFPPDTQKLCVCVCVSGQTAGRQQKSVESSFNQSQQVAGG